MHACLFTHIASTYTQKRTMEPTSGLAKGMCVKCCTQCTCVCLSASCIHTCVLIHMCMYLNVCIIHTYVCVLYIRMCACAHVRVYMFVSCAFLWPISCNHGGRKADCPGSCRQIRTLQRAKLNCTSVLDEYTHTHVHTDHTRYFRTSHEPPRSLNLCASYRSVGKHRLRGVLDYG
jgi:hypothetical protein